ncbi:nitrite reductase [Tessaracoccus sp. Y1736]
MTLLRDRRDQCPGALRPWPADDGLLVRLRIIGGRVATRSLIALAEVAERFGDGRVRVTGRANLQVRAFPGTDDCLDAEALAALESTGLLPSRSHELVRNVMVSPQSGLAGGRADLRPVSAAFDSLLQGTPRLADLPGRFLVVLDDGRGDLMERRSDLAFIALDADTGQLRAGGDWGEVVPIAAAPESLAALALRFLATRGSGPTAPWHVSELAAPLVAPAPPDPRLPTPAAPLPYGEVPGGRHVPVPDNGLDRTEIAALADGAPEVIVTPWRGVLVPRGESA